MSDITPEIEQEVIQAYRKREGARLLNARLVRFYDAVDARWPELDPKLRDEFAHEMHAQHMRDLAKRPRPSRRKATPTASE
jgi:uncharacterized membrane protein